MNVRPGVAITGHRMRLPALLDLAGYAETLGYDVLLLDGDAAAVPGRATAPIYDATSVAAFALARTERVRVGTLRLPFFSNVAGLARALAALQEGSRGRALALLGAGVGRAVARVGIPDAPARVRVDWLEETLSVLRPLLRGEPVRFQGRHVQIDDVSAPRVDPPPIIVAASGARTMKLVDRHADVWDANVPPIRERIEPLRDRLHRPVETWIWVFGRPGRPLERALREYRRHCPWFAKLPERDAVRALLHGEPERCRERLAALPGELGVERVVVDLIGLDPPECREALEALGPAKAEPMS